MTQMLIIKLGLTAESYAAGNMLQGLFFTGLQK